MAKLIPVMTLMECAAADGEIILEGRFGKARMVGRCRGMTDDGRRIWAMAVMETGEDARHGYAKRKSRPAEADNG